MNSLEEYRLEFMKEDKKKREEIIKNAESKILETGKDKKQNN